MKRFQYYLKNEQATQAFAQFLANLCQPPLFITLVGELGTGKTTLVRSLLRQLGVTGPIKSPTYSLVDVYQLNQLNIFHFDLYRLSSPEELELIGWRDYLAEDALWLIEWPEKAAELLPEIDISCHLTFVNDGRMLEISAQSQKGDKILDQLYQLIIKQ